METFARDSVHYTQREICMWLFGGSVAVTIVGNRHYNQSSLIEILGDSKSININATLKPEPENEHDPDAIVANTADGEKIGYVRREDIAKLKGKIESSGVQASVLIEPAQLTDKEIKEYEKIKGQERNLGAEISSELQYLRNADIPEKKRKRLYAAVETKRANRKGLDKRFKELYERAQGLKLTAKIKKADLI